MMKYMLWWALPLVAIAASCEDPPHREVKTLTEYMYFDKETGQTFVRDETERIRIEFYSSLYDPEFVLVYKGDVLLWTFQSSQFSYSYDYGRGGCFGEGDKSYRSICLKSMDGCIHYRGYSDSLGYTYEVSGDLIGLHEPSNYNQTTVGCFDKLLMKKEN